MAKRESDPDVDCDCPDCTVDVTAVFESVLELIGGMPDDVELFDIELATLNLAPLLEGAPELPDHVTDTLVPDIAQRGDSAALGQLEAIALCGADEPVAAARAQADRLRAEGVTAPSWVRPLTAPVVPGEFMALTGEDNMTFVLLGSFEKAGDWHVFLLQLHPLGCGEVLDIACLEDTALTELAADYIENAQANGMSVVSRELDAAEFRKRAEVAMMLRMEHGVDQPSIDEEDEDEPPFELLAELLLSRLRGLPSPSGELAVSHGELCVAGSLELDLDELFVDLPDLPELSETPTVLRLKATLKGLKPPIWRGFEVPGDLSLSGLHELIQVGFGWEDTHLHVFETKHGEFGDGDEELGHYPEDAVAVEQVLPENGKIRYRYDFGDDWEIEILAEKVRGGIEVEDMDHPRCTGGRRAAPPEDCGGVPGFAELLDNPGDFDPEAFDLNKVNETIINLYT